MKRALLAVLVAVGLIACETDVESPTPLVRSTPTPAATPAPAITPTPVPPPPTVSTNQPPTLVFKINPDPASGPAPWPVTVNMCQSSDPDGDPLFFEYKWGGEGRPTFSNRCREDHTYTQRGDFHAFFCVHDDHDHRVCHNEIIGIF